MITRMMLLVGCVWSLCPFLPLLPFPYQLFYALGALCLCAWRRRWAPYGLGLCWALAIGIGQLDHIGASQLPLEREDSLWRGEIKIQQVRMASLPNYAQVQAQIITTSTEEPWQHNLKGKVISLGWPNPNELQQGQHWLVSVKLRRLHGQLNPAGINFTAHNLSQSIYFTGQLQKSPAAQLIPVPPTLLDRLQNHFKTTLTASYASEYARFYLALALGDTSGLSQQDWQILQNTGTVHLMAISGFQIGLMASIGFWLGIMLAKPCCLLFNAQPHWQHWPRRLLPSVCSIALATLYTYLADFSLPAERAWVACLLVNGAWLLSLRPSLAQLWLWCWLVALACHPLAPLNTGFWLSYCAVAALLYFSAKKSRSGLVTQAIEAQWIITLALTLPQLVLNIPLSTTGFIANILIAPWISIVITPLVFILLTASLTLDASLGFSLLDKAYFIAWWSLEKISQLPATLWWPEHSLTTLDIMLAVVASLLLLLPRSLGFGYLGLILMSLSLLYPRSTNTAASIEVLDVGQGLAVLIKTPQHAILFDTGPSFSARFNAGTHILTPYLIARGIHSLQVIISRDNAEHAGGLRGLKQFTWQQLITAEPLAEYPNALPCTAGTQGNWDFIHWQIIAPLADTEDYSRSCALKLTIGNRSIYLFGDISLPQQRALLKQENTCCAYILLAPGQGAKNQHLSALAEHLKPEYTVFSNAARNRYQHPHADVIKAYQTQGSQLLLTAQLGALRWDWAHENAEPIFTSQWPSQQHYWYPQHSAGNLPPQQPSE